MSFNQEIQAKINQFAKEQARHYLDAAETTYLEKLRDKTDYAKEKVKQKLSQFKDTSDQAKEAQNDLIIYMSDYMSDLMSQGLTEEEAFAKAKEELSASSASDLSSDIEERFHQYFANLDPAEYETIGLFYGGFIIIGLVAGALIGYTLSGGRVEFLNGGWINTLVGAAAGLLIGVGLGLLSNGIFVSRKKR
ncbi:MAG: hypothetical protein FWC60_12670 [Firmicutes bacterium]|nr:hypothetical protein [Bacillota bacterium]